MPWWRNDELCGYLVQISNVFRFLFPQDYCIFQISNENHCEQRRKWATWKCEIIEVLKKIISFLFVCLFVCSVFVSLKARVSFSVKFQNWRGKYNVGKNLKSIKEENLLKVGNTWILIHHSLSNTFVSLSRIS